MASGSAAPLSGRVAVVAGATRGAGRGIACMLGEAGAAVYCTGRSTRDRPPTSRHLRRSPRNHRRNGRDGDGARAAGASPFAWTTSCRKRSQALFERVSVDEGRLDVLVNDISEGELHDWKPFWKVLAGQGLSRAQARRPLPHHHEPLRGAADDRQRPRPDRRDRRRRHARLPPDALLRSRQGERQPLRVRHGRGVEAAWRGRAGDFAGLHAQRDDARALRRHGSELARRREEGSELHRVGDAVLRRTRGRGACGRPARARRSPAVSTVPGVSPEEYGFTDIDGSQPDMGAQFDFEAFFERSAKTPFRWTIERRTADARQDRS